MFLSMSEGCNAKAVTDYIAACTKSGTSLRAFRMYRKGELLSATFTPHAPEDPMHLYSLSKSFTSTAVGIAQDMGLLHVDEKIIDIFPECVPEEISDNLARMTLGDVLSMQSGHEVCHLNQMRFSDDAIKTFLAMPVVYTPGTTFVYSTGGTCICGAAVEKRSGMKLNDFLDTYLFSKLGIPKPKQILLTDGHHCGGTGMYLSPEDLLKFGMMLLHNGVYDGKRIVSEEWLKKATSKIADNSCNGTPDWVAGYGYQFWKNARCGYRGDGAFGQLLLVLPEEDTVFVQQAEVNDMQTEVTNIYTLLDSIEGKSTQEDLNALRECMNAYNKPQKTAETSFAKTVSFAQNMEEIRSATLSSDGKVLNVRLETAYGTQTLKAGNGFWAESHPMLRYANASITQLDPRLGQIETLNLASCYVCEGDHIRIIAKHTDTPHTQEFFFGEGGLQLSANVGTLHPDAYVLKYV